MAKSYGGVLCQNINVFPLVFARFVEPLAGVVQGRSGADIRVSALDTAAGPVSDGAMQRQPAGGSAGGGRGLQTGRQSTSTISMQGAGAGRRHHTVSTLWIKKCSQEKSDYISFCWTDSCLPIILFSQQATQRRQHLQIRHSKDNPKQAQDKRLREEEKKVIII